MPDAPTSPVTGHYTVQASFWATGLFFLVLLVVFHDTTWSMIAIWLRSDTFAHGFTILPISLWLAWNKRDHLHGINPRPALAVALLMIPPGFVWLLAWLVDVLVVQQLALVAMLVVGAWAIMGHQLARALAFPLLFLFFAVPMGEALVLPMMEFTATSTVWLIQQTGIPVYREGLYFTLPSGNWSVVEACSGVRYIIASITLGVLYAYLTYRSAWRRVLFVFVSAVVPVLANTGRAYMIVMLGHVSDMTIATGVDHLIYGWLFFGFVIFILFWLGTIWREDDKPSEIPVNRISDSTNPGASLLTACFMTIVMAGVWPILARAIEQPRAETGLTALLAPPSVGDWQPTSEVEWDWRPIGAGPGHEISQFYYRDNVHVALYIQQYLQQQQGAELISGKGDEFIDQKLSWRIAESTNGLAALGSASVTVNQFVLNGRLQRLQLWNWYRIGNHYTANPYVAKLYAALAALTYGRQDAARIVLATPVTTGESAGHTLQEFINAYLPAIEMSLDAAAGESQQ